MTAQALAMLVRELTAEGPPEDKPVFLWSALQQAAVGWRHCGTREGVHSTVAAALDLAMMAQELVVSPRGTEALDRLVKRAEREVVAARARKRRSGVSDEGIRLVGETREYLRADWSPERIASQLAHSVQVSPHIRAALGYDVTLPSGEVSYALPSGEAVRRAVKAIEKHLWLRENDDEHYRAQIVVSHALLAFDGRDDGALVSTSWARNAVGLKRSGAARARP